MSICSYLSFRLRFNKTPANNSRCARTSLHRLLLWTFGESLVHHHSTMLFVRIFRASCKTCDARAGFRQWIPLQIRDKRAPPGTTSSRDTTASNHLSNYFSLRFCTDICMVSLCHKPSIASAAHKMMPNDKQMQDAKSSMVYNPLPFASLSTVVRWACMSMV